MLKPEAKKMLYFQILIILGFGLIYLTIIPQFEGPDEASHFMRAYGISEGQFILKDHPRNLVQFIKKMLEIRRNDDIPHIIKEMERNLNQYKNRIPNIVFNTSLYSPIPYLPFAAAIKFVSIFDKSDHGLILSMYLCRLVSLLCFASLILLSFQYLRSASWPVFWIAATPMSLSQISTVSIDSIILGSSIILITASLGNIKDRTYSLSIILSSFILLISKPTYISLLIIPAIAVFYNAEQEKRPIRMKSVLLAFVISIGGLLIWNYLAKSHGIYEASLGIIKQYGEINLNPVYQLSFIIENPVKFCMIILKTLSLNSIALYHQFVGVLGMLDIPIPFWAAVGWGIFSILAILVSRAPQHIQGKNAFATGTACIAAAFLAFIAVFVSAYMIWMPVGSETINLQGRYFHPIIAAIFIGMVLLTSSYINKFREKYKRVSVLCLVFGTFAINIITFFTLFQKYMV